MSEAVGTVLISPHSDDAAYSVGGAILSGFFPQPLLIVTPLTVSIYGGYILGDPSVTEVSRLRAAEDETFARQVGARLLMLALPDATLSSKTGEYFFPLLAVASLLVGWPPPRNRIERGIRAIVSRTPLVLRSELLYRVARFDGLRMVLREQITRILDQSPRAVLVSPLGLGNHPNHIVVASVCRSLRKKVSRLYFYEDLPYASRYSLQGIERHVASFDSQLRPVVVNIGEAAEDKIKNLSFFSSQAGPREIAKVKSHAERLSSDGRFQERLWTYQMQRAGNGSPHS